MGMGFPMGPRIPWESHGNWNKTQNWEWEWEGMGNHLSGNAN